MNVNSHYIKFGGKLEIPEPLQNGFTYKVVVDGAIDTISHHDNHDGTFDAAYHFKPITGNVEKEHGEAIKTKDSRSMGQKLRSTVWKWWNADHTETREQEQAYEDIIKYVILHMDEIWDKAK